MNPSESSLELQALLDAAVDGIVVIDHLGLIHTFNRSAEQLFGYQNSEVLGQNVSILMPSGDRCAHDEFLERYVKTRTPHIIGKGREVSARRKDGTVFPALLAVGLVPLSEPPRFVGFIRDNSAQRHAEAEAYRLQERLTHVSRLATIGEMSSGIAHELNQPLAAIATYAHACDRLLGLEDPEIGEVRGALREIAQQAVRAGDIIRRLRSLAKAEAAVRRPVDVNCVLEQLTELIEADASAHGVSYQMKPGEQLPPVLLDPSQIQQVIMNLVHNAIEALALTAAGGRQLVISTRVTDTGDTEISVRDTGPGVDAAMVGRMFDPFCSTKPTGTGLGLPISRTIVRDHGGMLEYAPNEPRGACFTLTLPAAPADST